MKIPKTEEYISEISTLIKTQNRQVKKYLEKENDEKILKLNSPKYVDIINKYEQLKEYVENKIMPAINNIPNNDRYLFCFVEGMLIEEDRKYFKLIIENKISNAINFIVLSYDTRNIFIEIKIANSKDNFDTYSKTYSIEKFTKGKYRKIFFEYFLEIVNLDTLPKLKRKKESIEVVDENEILNRITKLNTEIDRIRKLSERNKNILEETKARQKHWKQYKKEKSKETNF